MITFLKFLQRLNKTLLIIQIECLNYFEKRAYRRNLLGEMGKSSLQLWTSVDHKPTEAGHAEIFCNKRETNL